MAHNQASSALIISSPNLTPIGLAVQPPRPKSIQTDPPARVELDNQVSQDVIYDFYEKHLAEIQAEKDKANTKQKSSDKEKSAKCEFQSFLSSFLSAFAR